MTLTYRQERLLRRADRALSESDPDLATMLSIFAQISAAEGLPAWEQLGARLTRALTIALWPVAALVFLAYFIADGEIRPATASGAAMRRRALCLCLKLLGRADGRYALAASAYERRCRRARLRGRGCPPGRSGSRQAVRVPGW